MAAVPTVAHRFLLVGVHGGVGVTTLAWLLGPSAIDFGAARDWRRLSNPARYPVVLACRSTVASTGQAVAEVSAACAAGVLPRALLVVEDGWPMPAVARARLDLLAPRVPAVVRVPYVPAWRYADSPDPTRLPRPVVRALATLLAALNDAHPHAVRRNDT